MISAKTIKKTALAPTVLISHGGGFLAASLAQTLLLKNCRVVVLSDLSQHKDPQLHSLLKSPRFALFDCNVNDELSDSIESVDYIFHLTNYDTFLNVDNRPDLEGLLSASVGTKNLLDLAKRSQAKFALVCPLSSTVKDDGKKGVTVEEAQKYSKSLVLEYRERYELDARLVYLGRVYGPGMDLTQSGEIGNLIGNVLERKSLKICGDGVRKEFYLFFSDAINGLIKSLFSAGQKESFTLVEGKSHTALEVAYILKSLADRKVDIEFAESNEVYKDPVANELSYPTAWSPKVELKDGLAKTLKSFGYKPNARPFKVGALIEEKKLEKLRSTVSSMREGLQTITPPPRGEPKISPLTLLLCRAEKGLRWAVETLRSKDPALRQVKILAGSIVAVAFLLGIFLGIPLLQSYNHAKSALNDLENYQLSISKLDTQESQKLSENAYNHLSKLEHSLNRTALLFKISGNSKMFESLQAYVASSKNFSSALYSLSLGAEPFSNLWEGLKPNSTPDYNLEKFKEASSHFMSAKQKLGFAQASLGNVDKRYLPPSVRDDFEKYQRAVDKLRENGDFLTQLALEFPKIVGLEGQKRYLFLFQNNNEIRPTGGFLGSYAVVEMVGGKISRIDIDDIYNPDGQLKLSKANADVKPPAPIAEALKEETLFIRNANWDPSFPQSGQTINNLFKLIDGKSFDGIFAVDLYFVRDLLSVTGPLYLTAYDEEIRVDNMYERAQFHSDFDFKEGVSTKKAFMTILGGKMLEKLFALPQDKIPALLNVLYSSLEQRHLLADLSGTYVSKYLAEKGWNGELLDTRDDYLYVVNANLGGTKSNYYVKNSMNYAISGKTSDGLLRGELELTYENTQKDASWPGGPYKNYVRVLVQDGSRLTGAFLMGGQEGVLAAEKGNDVMGAANGVNIFDKVVISKVGKYTSFEYLITVNPQEKVKLLFTYDLPASLSAKKDTNKYSLVWQKQPGTQNDSVRFLFAAPFGTNIVERFPAGTLSNNVYEYKGVLNSDLRVGVYYK